VIQNSFLILVEDGYLSSKYSGRYDWISKQAIDPSKSAGHEGEDPEEATKNLLYELPLDDDKMMVNEYLQARRVIVKEKSKTQLNFSDAQQTHPQDYP